MERHSTKNCWREYLKLCFIHNTLTVSKNVNDDVNGKLQLLKTLLFGNSTVLPSTGIVKLFHLNTCTCIAIQQLVYNMFMYV